MATQAVQQQQQQQEQKEVEVAESGLRGYYVRRIEDLNAEIRERLYNQRRLEARRNALNAQVRELKEELVTLREPGSHVGEVVKVMGKNKVLVKVNNEGKYVVELDPSVPVSDVTPTTRVALRSDRYTLHKILPNKVDPLVSLMKVEKVPDSTYDMIGGLDRQIREIKEVIELPIKHPELFESLGIAQPKGVLLYGPPGTGKTMLAKAVAHHTDAAFISVVGSEFVQKYLGEGPRMVRDVFRLAREHSPSIVFIDEIDAIATKRFDAQTGADREVQRILIELLNQMDGFDQTTNVKVIMATNRADTLDPALLRPGRLDRKIEFPTPDRRAKRLIFQTITSKMNLSDEVDLEDYVSRPDKISGADIQSICQEAGMQAVRRNRYVIIPKDFEHAYKKVVTKKSDEYAFYK